MEIPYRERSRWLAVHVLPHEPAMRSWLRRTTQASDADVDDIVQETYAVLARLDSVAAIQTPRTYAFQVARSIFLQGLRRSKIVSIESFGELAALDVPDDVPNPEQQMIGRHELRRVEAAIETMPTQVRKVFWLRRVEGLSQRQTANQLGLAEHTVEKYSAKGMKLLLAQFGRGGNTFSESSKVQKLKLIESDLQNAQSRTTR